MTAVMPAPAVSPPVDSADVTTRKMIPVADEAQAAAVARLKKVGREWTAVNDRRDKKHAELREEIRKAAAAGLRPQYIIRATGAARETVFKVLRDQGTPVADDAPTGES